MSEIIFDGKSLRVTLQIRSPKSIFVTFTERNANLPFVHGFAEPILMKNDFSSLSFISKQNHWWQTKELDSAIEAARITLDNAGIVRRIGYGSSMGAFGAMLMAERLALTQVIALSPQFSIENSVVPFESRYNLERNAIERFIHQMPAIPVKECCRALIFFDPFDLDCQHAKLFEKKPNIDFIRVPVAGHPVGPPLLEMNILKQIIFDSHEGLVDVVALRHRIRKASRADERYLRNLTVLTYAKGHMKLCEIVARRLLASFPGNYDGLRYLSYTLFHQKRWASAVEAAREVADADPTNAVEVKHYGSILLATGSAQASVDVARQLTSLHPKFAPGWGLYADALSILGRHQEAAAATVQSAITGAGIESITPLWNRVLAAAIKQAAETPQ